MLCILHEPQEVIERNLHKALHEADFVGPACVGVECLSKMRSGLARMAAADGASVRAIETARQMAEDLRLRVVVPRDSRIVPSDAVDPGVLFFGLARGR